jgi:uncharacterized integral membrane protein
MVTMSSEHSAVPDPAEPAAVPAPTPAKGPAKPAEQAKAPDKTTKNPESAVKFTRTAALWTALVIGFLVLILLLVFIIQNGNEVPIHLFTWEWNVQLGVAILLAAVAGGLLAFSVAGIRLLQLRLAARKNLKGGL